MSANQARCIALLTDFGHQDAYAGVMKGVLLSRLPLACLVDLTHGIAPQDVLGGALQLMSAVPYFPEGTVFLAVVDPGVGSERRPLCISAGGFRFVGPDNGLLRPAAQKAASLSGDSEIRTYVLDRSEQWLPEPGATFHGRDIFAPVAALLASGVAPEAVGTRIRNPVRLEIPVARRSAETVLGAVVYIDGYGNAVTNLTPEDLQTPAPETLRFTIRNRAFTGPCTHYGARPWGELLLVLGSLGYYEVAINGGSAAGALNLKRGDPIVVRPHLEATAG